MGAVALARLAHAREGKGRGEGDGLLVRDE